MINPNKTWTVSEINRLIKEVLDQTFYPFRVRGEISNLIIHRSGHVYFSLKDSRCQLSAVYFRAAAEVREMQLRNGMEVDIDGRVTVYEVRGTCQILVNRILPLGAGVLQKKLEELKEKLRAEGLFDETRKRQIPKFPAAVGVITSTQGAAIRDFCQILNRRFADLRVRIYPAAVQGENAAEEISKGIKFFNHHQNCDVIVLTRGGGSLEDLWPFNEEIVARNIAASNIPVISAIGHEVDYTISDFVADLRVPTPSAAAELVVQEKSRLREQVTNARQRLSRAARLNFSEWRRRLEKASSAAALRQPVNMIRQFQQRVDECVLKMQYSAEKKTEKEKRSLQSLEQRLRALSPEEVLQRGYSILLDSRGKCLKNSRNAHISQELTAILARGKMQVQVTGKTEMPEDDSE